MGGRREGAGSAAAAVAAATEALSAAVLAQGILLQYEAAVNHSDLGVARARAHRCRQVVSEQELREIDFICVATEGGPLE